MSVCMFFSRYCEVKWMVAVSAIAIPFACEKYMQNYSDNTKMMISNKIERKEDTKRWVFLGVADLPCSASFSPYQRKRMWKRASSRRIVVGKCGILVNYILFYCSYLCTCTIFGISEQQIYEHLYINQLQVGKVLQMKWNRLHFRSIQPCSFVPFSFFHSLCFSHVFKIVAVAVDMCIA